MCVLKDIPQAQVKGSSIVGAVHVNENLTLLPSSSPCNLG